MPLKDFINYLLRIHHLTDTYSSLKYVQTVLIRSPEAIDFFLEFM